MLKQTTFAIALCKTLVQVCYEDANEPPSTPSMPSLLEALLTRSVS
ncbi:hypothetical protein [uncultured Nostoc sp.]